MLVRCKRCGEMLEVFPGCQRLHAELCAGLDRIFQEKARDQNHELRIVRLYGSALDSLDKGLQKRLRLRKRPAPPSGTLSVATGDPNRPYWCGPVPPWDESLGEYRNFTVQEMIERKVCRLIAAT